MASTAVAGCGGDDGDPTAPTDPEPPTEPDLGDFPVGKFELVVEEGDAPAAFLEGRWTKEVQSDGDFFVTHESAGSVAGVVSVADDEITFRDLGGSLACTAPQESGTYRWTETDATVTFSVVSDGCDGRRFVMPYGPWNKQ
ncbi:MAG: hypothetical protein ACOC9N_00995 [Gemmatimonadota bacterium]